MKKGLLLSVVASTMIFAGGDIAPVEPAAPASADFWGQIGFAYQFQDSGAYNLGDKENNAFSATVVLGVEKQLGYGFGFGFELAGWTDFGWNIANGPRVFSSPNLGGVQIFPADQTSAEVSQAYLTYTFGNTAIKAGRQALPKAVSPWAWSDRSAGVLDITYDAVVIANTDLPDTTLVGAYVANVANDGVTVHLGEINNLSVVGNRLDIDAKIDGIYMLAAINKSLPNTTLALTGYYVPKFLGNKAEWSIWGSANSNFDGIKTGLQVAYVDGDYSNTDASYGVAAKIGSSWGDFDATLIAGYINDGDYSLTTAGYGPLVGGTSAFWTDNEEAGDVMGALSGSSESQVALLVKAGYKLPYGKLYGSLGYWNFDDNGAGDLDYTFGARLGYKFTVAGVNAKVEYRYRNRNYVSAPDQTRQRIRVEAYYKF